LTSGRLFGIYKNKDRTNSPEHAMDCHEAAQAELCRLRRDIARIEGRLAEADRMVLDSEPGEAEVEQQGIHPSRRGGKGQADGAHPTTQAGADFKPRERRGRLRLGQPALDAILNGGLPLATLHEIRPGETRDCGAAAGFALALVSRLAEAGGVPSVVWISEARSRLETGALYPPGLLALGLDPARVVEVSTRTGAEALWAFEAALACPGLGAAICELRGVSLDLSATRRCVLRAREAGVTGLLLRLGGAAEPSAAEVRLRLSPAPAGTIGDFGEGVGRIAWRVAVEKNRGGRTGTFLLEWNAHERRFAEPPTGRRSERDRGGDADFQHLPAAPSHRPDRPAETDRAGVASGGNWRRAF
jgi:protein ImuA